MIKLLSAFLSLLFQIYKLSEDSSAKYYQNIVERLQKEKKTCERCQSLSKEEKEKKRQYGCERYKNLPDD